MCKKWECREKYHEILEESLTSPWIRSCARHESSHRLEITVGLEWDFGFWNQSPDVGEEEDKNPTMREREREGQRTRTGLCCRLPPSPRALRQYFAAMWRDPPWTGSRWGAALVLCVGGCCSLRPRAPPTSLIFFFNFFFRLIFQRMLLHLWTHIATKPCTIIPSLSSFGHLLD